MRLLTKSDALEVEVGACLSQNRLPNVLIREGPSAYKHFCSQLFEGDQSPLHAFFSFFKLNQVMALCSYSVLLSQTTTCGQSSDKIVHFECVALKDCTEDITGLLAQG